MVCKIVRIMALGIASSKASDQIGNGIFLIFKEQSLQVVYFGRLSVLFILKQYIFDSRDQFICGFQQFHYLFSIEIDEVIIVASLTKVEQSCQESSRFRVDFASFDEM